LSVVAIQCHVPGQWGWGTRISEGRQHLLSSVKNSDANYQRCYSSPTGRDYCAGVVCTRRALTSWVSSIHGDSGGQAAARSMVTLVLSSRGGTSALGLALCLASCGLPPSGACGQGPRRTSSQIRVKDGASSRSTLRYLGIACRGRSSGYVS